MLDLFRKKTESSPIVLFKYENLTTIKELLSNHEAVSGAAIKNDNTIEITLKYDKKLKCMMRLFDGGKAVLVAFWDLNKKNKLANIIGSRLWNDRKEDSHHTYSYITQKDVCVFESHLNLEWGVSQLYFSNWYNSYIDHIPEFKSHISEVSETLKNLPKSKLNALEKLEMAAEIGDVIGTIAQLLDI